MSADPLVIGRYRVQRLLGGGAMGLVYLAEDPLLKRPVAIKTVREVGEGRAIALKRFQQEAEISARLSHPNIITVFDVGEDPDVGPFLAMEYVDGTSLSALIRTKIAPEAGLRLLLQAMDALMAAGKSGIAHRDVKPDNMLVGKDGRLKLMDFGIARRNESSHLTQAGMVFGTPSYTAPEMLIGREASPATDRYALAVVAYELLSGTLPFTGSSVGTTLYRIVHEAIQFPDTFSPALVAVFSRALAKDPEVRYPDLPLFMDALLKAVDLPEDVRAHLLTLLKGDSAYGTQPVLLPPTPQPQETTSLKAHPSEPPPAEKPSESLTFAAQVAPAAEPAPQAPAPVEKGMGPTPAVPLQRFVWPILGSVLALAAAGILLWAQHHPRIVRIDVSTQPPGAIASIDGRQVGETPVAPLELPRGGHLLRLELQGFQPLSYAINPRDRHLEFKLQRLPYTLAVLTDPPGAEAFLNGSRVGVTPLPALSVPSEGQQELILKLNGYQEWSAILDKDAPFPAIIHLSPK